MKSKSFDFRPHLALFTVNALYAASHILAKGIMPSNLGPAVFILFRAGGAAILFWTLAAFIKLQKIEKADIGRLFLCGFFGVALNQLCFFHGLSLSTAVNAGIIMAINPIFVLILSFVFLKIPITKKQVLGIILGATGAIALTYTSATSYSSNWKGDFFLIINCLSFAIYLILSKPLMSKYSPLTVITYTFTFGVGLVMLFPPVWTEAFSTNFSSFTFDIMLKILFVIIGVTFLTYLLTIYGLSKLTPTQSSSYIYFQPVLVIVFAFLFFKLGWAPDFTKTITWDKYIWMACIFVGVYFTSNFQRKT